MTKLTESDRAELRRFVAKLSTEELEQITQILRGRQHSGDLQAQLADAEKHKTMLVTIMYERLNAAEKRERELSARVAELEGALEKIRQLTEHERKDLASIARAALGGRRGE